MADIIDYETLGKRIKRRRRMEDLTQEQLGELVGCSKSFIGCVENHTSIPSLVTIVKIADALGVTPDYFLLGVERDKEHGQRIAEKLSLCSPEDQARVELFVDALIENCPSNQTK